MIKKIAFFLGPLIFVFLYNIDLIPGNPLAGKVISVAAWMVVWWLTETVSISVTALIPITLFPLLQIMDMRTVASNYADPIVFLFFGGFVMALALEKVNLHRRIALNIIKITGTSPDNVVLGFMISTALLSMWISNTASTVVMLPIAISVIKLLIDDADGFSPRDANFALSIMLGIAFAANIGGIATLIGTPPNSVLAGFMQREYGIEISFLNWMKMGLPFSAIMLVLCYLVVVKWIYPSNLDSLNNAGDLINDEISKLGKLKIQEKNVIAVFAVAIFLWVTKNYVNRLLDGFELSDAGISMIAAMSLFVIPENLRKGQYILNWHDTIKLPWGILILFGGGLALASGLSGAGIISMIGDMIASREGGNVMMIISLLIFVMLFMTELMSNVALVAIFVPVVAGIAIGLDVPMLHICVPVAMASSCAFMLPMATPPNAIVFASGHVKVYQMAKVGLILNIISVLLLLVFTKFIIPILF